jgi:hypothetical protein
MYLEMLKVKMDVIADYWKGIHTELGDINRRVQGLRYDHVLEMRIKTFTRRWKEIAQDYKSYINAVSAFMLNRSCAYFSSAQHTPQQQSTIQGIYRLKGDNSA